MVSPAKPLKNLFLICQSLRAKLEAEDLDPPLHEVPVASIADPDTVEIHQAEVPILSEPPVLKIRSLKDISPLPKPLKESDFYNQWRTRRVLYIPPLSQDVSFLVGWNSRDENSYWTAVSQIIYGLPRYWPWVKANHKLYMREVLEDPNHPRHEMYKVIAGEVNDEGKTTLEILDKPSGQVPDEIYQVTADLYDIYLVKFTMKKTASYVVSQVDSRGCRNARHLFLMFSHEFQYAPVRPVVERPSEFHYPELRSSSLALDKMGIRRHFRDESNDPLIASSYRKHSMEMKVPEQLIPRPTMPLPSEADIANTISGLRPRGGFSVIPGWIPGVPTKKDDGPKDGAARVLHKATEYAGLTHSQITQNREIYETLSDDKLRAFCDSRRMKINPFRNDRKSLIDDLLGDDVIWPGKERAKDPSLRSTPLVPESFPHPHKSKSPLRTTQATQVSHSTVEGYMEWTWNQLYNELKRRDYAGKTGNKLYKLKKKAQMAIALADLDRRQAGEGGGQGVISASQKRRADEINNDMKVVGSLVQLRKRHRTK